MPVSSLEIAITAQSYFLTSGSTRSSRSSSPVTELSSGRPRYAASPASSASTMELSMDSGTSTVSCTSRDALGEDAQLVGERDAGVHVQHLRPASTCATASATTRE